MADYDYIIVGAGSAGGALAARLSENSKQQDSAAGSRRGQPSLLAHAALIRPADRQSRRQLVLPVRTRARNGQPNHSRAARKTPGRIELDQRPGLGARPAARLRHLGADGLPRLELARRGAGLHPDREFRRRRRQQRPRHFRPTESLDRARPEPALRRAVRGVQGGRLQAQPRLQQRGPGRRRQDADLDLQGPAHERRPLLHRAGDEALAQPPGRHQRHDPARPARGQALRRRRVREGRQGRAGARARDHPVGGRRGQSADPGTLRHRPARAAEEARHRGEARAAGRWARISATTSTPASSGR